MYCKECFIKIYGGFSDIAFKLSGKKITCDKCKKTDFYVERKYENDISKCYFFVD